MMSEIQNPEFKNPYESMAKAALMTINEFLGMKIESFAEMRASVEDEALDIAMSTLQDVQTMINECLEDIKHSK